jgi:peptidoglycan/xylan/chitin deacetylase (PgdA/CDA1 family)
MKENTVWPQGQKFALCITHDIDRVDKKWWHNVYYYYKTKNKYHIKTIFKNKNLKPYWNFDTIIGIEEKYNVRSTFFFLNETKRTNIFKPSTYKLTFGNYSIHDPRIIRLMQQLDSQGWEIAVHGSYDSYTNEELLRIEKQTLESIIKKPISGVRQHYLRLDNTSTWRYQESAGFLYDASFGYTDRIGFKDGIDLPFVPKNQNLVVLPLTVMDGPLFSKYSLEEAWNQCQELIDQASENHSLITILWHNNRFNEDEYPGQTKVFEMIISECRNRGAWIAPCREIASWWMNGR